MQIYKVEKYLLVEFNDKSIFFITKLVGLRFLENSPLLKNVFLLFALFAFSTFRINLTWYLIPVSSYVNLTVTNLKLY